MVPLPCPDRGREPGRRLAILEAMDNKSPLGLFLQVRRAQLKPEDVGHEPYGERRRAAGLRREELAGLAGVSESYKRLEQGMSLNAPLPTCSTASETPLRSPTGTAPSATSVGHWLRFNLSPRNGRWYLPISNTSCSIAAHVRRPQLLPTRRLGNANAWKSARTWPRRTPGPPRSPRTQHTYGKLVSPDVTFSLIRPQRRAQG